MRTSCENYQLEPYICQCGKIYRTQSSISTHIKNKHNPSYKLTMVRPSWCSTKRGRPKTKQVGFFSNQHQQLENEEQCLLEIYELLSEMTSQHIILGLSLSSPQKQQWMAIYAQMNPVLPIDFLESELFINQKIKIISSLYEFATRLIRHMPSEMTARIYLILNLIVKSSKSLQLEANNTEQLYEGFKRIQQNEKWAIIWFGCQRLPIVILDYFIQWFNVKQ